MNENNIRSKAANIFLEAASYIRKYGWQVEGMSKHGQPRCSMGALASAYPRSEWERDISSLMYTELYQELDGLSLTEFNHKFNDGYEVAKLFERTALSLLR